MLKSTHNKAQASTGELQSSLPPGWTEHRAPTGHLYYYHTESKQSTYTRPAELVSDAGTQHHGSFPHSVGSNESNALFRPPEGGPFHQGEFSGGPSFQDRARRHQPQDRPKKKRAIPGCEPWFLVTTKLGRRFVYHADKNESFWKFPQDVLLATVEMDRKDQEEAQAKRRAAKNTPEARTDPQRNEVRALSGEQALNDGSDSYEEVEVTDDEGDASGREEGPSKKARTESADQQPSGPVEFNEDDIAYQLAQMGDDYGLDSGEYGDGEDDEHDGGLPLSLEDSKALFFDLLSDHKIDPYSTWDQIIEEGRIIDDARYVAFPTMRARKEAFSDWSTEQIQILRIKRAQETKKDPKIPYIEFLHKYATPKLYWPEFKRKYRKDEGMKDPNLSDKDREKFYRELINRLKQPESTRKAEFNTLLKSAPLEQLNGRSTLETIPSSILTDLRFITLSLEKRNSLLEAYILTLPLPVLISDSEAQETEDANAKAADRERRERALKAREQKVQEEKRVVMGRLRQGRELLRDEERDIEEALRLKGMEGLKGYLPAPEESQEES